MRNAVLVLVCSLTLAACVAHEKAGDSAAAVGDWKSAYNHYRQALAEKPDTPGLKDKHDQARNSAVAEAWDRAQGCEATGDWRCAYDEAEFVRSLNPLHNDAIALRGRASTQLAIAEVNQARVAAGAGKFQEAIAILNKARSSTQDPAVQKQAGIVQQEVVNGANLEADRLRKNQQYNESIALYELLAGLDGKYREAVRAVTEEREQHLVAAYEAEARRGDEALHNNDFRAAHAAYIDAEKLRPHGRAEPLLKYTAALIAADDAVTARNWPNAERALRDAVNTGKDDGRAAEMLERVKIRTYKVALRSVLLKPTRLDGSTWIGNTTPLFFRISQQIANALQKNNYERAIANTMDLPYENRPNLKVFVDFPDGMRLETPARQGGYGLFDGEFTVSGNGFDETTRITFRVVQEKGLEEIGRLEVSLKDLISHRDFSARSQTIAQLRLLTEPAEGRHPGAFAGFIRLDNPNDKPVQAEGQQGTANAAPASGTQGTANAAPAAGTPGSTGTTAPASSGTTGTTAPASSGTTGTTAPAGGAAAQPAPSGTQPAAIPPAPPGGTPTKSGKKSRR